MKKYYMHEESTIFCKHCVESIDEDSTFCKKCQKLLNYFKNVVLY